MVRKYKLRHDARSFCLKNATGKVSLLQLQTAISAMWERDKCCWKTRQVLSKYVCYAKAPQVLCENATNAMLICEKCYANMWQVLCELNAVSVMEKCEKHGCANMWQLLCEYVTSVMRKRDKCYAKMRQMLCDYVKKRYLNVWQV